MKLLCSILILAFAACDGRKDSSTEDPNTAQISKEKRSLNTPESTRTNHQPSAGTASLKKMEKALEASDHDQALIAFRELINSHLEISEAAFREYRQQGDGKLNASDLEALDKRVHVLESWIAEARIDLRNHGVEQAAIDEAFLTSKKKTGEIAIAREMEGLEPP